MTATATKEKTQLVDRANPSPMIPQSKAQAIAVLDSTSRQASEELRNTDSDIVRAMVMANGIKKLEAALTPEIMADVVQLQNTPLGFRTDKAGSGYSVEQLRPVVCMALLRGLRLTGNEWNVIAGNLYVTKEGFQRLLAEFPGLSNLHIDIGVPESKGEGALVPCRAGWKMHGDPDYLDCTVRNGTDFRIPIRVNKAMGMDAILGKAKSKLLRRVYERVTGSVFESDADGDDNVLEGTVATEGQD